MAITEHLAANGITWKEPTVATLRGAITAATVRN